MRRFLVLLLLLTTVANVSFGQTTYTLSSGCTNSAPGSSCDWGSGSSWIGGVAPVGANPAAGDIIVIPENTFVQIEEVQIIVNNDVELQVFGELFIYSKGGSIGNLTLASGSVIKIASTGDIEARQTNTTGGGAGNADKNFLTIGSETIDGSEINGLASPNQVTEGTMASGNAGCAETGTCESDPLPIVLAYFNVDAQDNEAKIHWATYTEENNDYFTLERSSDGVNYEALTTVDGAGNSTEFLRYQYIDKAPLFGRSYYRLTQTDYDGASETFSAVSVYRSTLDEFFVHPNPVESGQTLKIFSSSSKDEEVTMTLLNSAGMTVSSKQLVSGQNEVKIDDQIKSGMYILKVKSGSNTVVKRLLVK